MKLWCKIPCCRILRGVEPIRVFICISGYCDIIDLIGIRIGVRFEVLQHIILLQPLPHPIMLCLIFGFHITNDLLEVGFVPDAVE